MLSFVLCVDQRIDCQQEEEKRSYRRCVKVVIGIIIPRLALLLVLFGKVGRQHKLDLNLSKTKQPLPIITNSHLNFRYLTASANL